jgi:phosphotransferase system enzyme I (PtsI)
LAKGGRHALRREAGTPTQERTALEAAIAGSLEGLSALAGHASGRAADSLGRQIASLSDPELLEPVLEAIAGGEPAETAFRDGMDLLIIGGRDGGAGEPRVRAEDLADLRDRVLGCLLGEDAAANDIPEGAILVAEALTVSRFLEIDWRRAGGAVSLAGSLPGHVALLARARDVPLLFGPKGGSEALTAGLDAVLDAEAGRLILAPSATTRRDYDRRIAERRREREQRERWLLRPAVTRDGTVVPVYLNVDDTASLAAVDPAHCDGIGLARSEFLFRPAAGPPDEERQYRVYRALLAWAGGLPVTVRTLDAGGDKPMASLTAEDETDPLSGLRGLRLSLARPEVFRVQLRALARAAAHGPLRVMVPLVTAPEAFARARALLLEEVTALRDRGVPAAMPAFGMMVETPAAARAIATFDADFYAIGTNDLTRLVTAGGRADASAPGPRDPSSPAVLELVARICDHGREAGREVNLCGEAAGRPECIPALLKAGVRALSVPPAVLAETKRAIAGCRLDEAPRTP